jgi:hypothetical protein
MTPLMEGKVIPADKISAQRPFTFQEATSATLVRTFITVKTHPKRLTVRMSGRLHNVRRMAARNG